MKLSEEARMIRDAVADFARAELLPTAEKRDAAGTLDRTILERFAELGVFGLSLPEVVGGLGAGPLAVALVFEEIAACCPSTALAVHSHGLLSTEALAGAVSMPAAARLLEEVLAGKRVVSFANGEGVVATQEGREFRLEGRVSLVPALEVADWILVRAEARGEPTLFLVARDAGGVRIEKGAPALGMRASGLASLFMVRGGPATRLASFPGTGLSPLGRLSLAAIGVGIARGALECAKSYAKSRTQFARPISEFGAIRTHLAEMALAVESSRSLVHRAGAALEEGARAEFEIAVAKLAAGEAAVRVSDRAVQIHGGYGYIADYPAERYYRDAQFPRSLHGVDDGERALIADAVLA